MAAQYADKIRQPSGEHVRDIRTDTPFSVIVTSGTAVSLWS
ncbi:hypothetical protein [Candidatus Arsenophonus triatominarum]|nr:hypothetical protein [Candidatus Arsenophonus triatominarum]